MIPLLFLQMPPTNPIQALLPATAPAGKSPKSFATGKYRSLFREIGKSDAEIKDKLNKAWSQFFYGDDKDERVYYAVGDDMGYIKDIGSNDVRTEGMSYGMMIAVQYGQKDVFDRIWRWSKKYMQHQEGPMKGFFAWQCKEDGQRISEGAAPDGEEYFVTALFFAANRWGSGQGILNYRAEADAILHAMLHKDGEKDVTNMFDKKAKQVVFSPGGAAAGFTDPSYHLPGFYELWSRWAKEDRPFWKAAATASREFFRKVANPKTGLTPDHTSFEGVPMKSPWDPNSKADNFLYDSFRTAGNIAMDHAWFAVDPWQVEENNRLLEFFAAQNPPYVANYTLEGKPLVESRSGGLAAMNAVAALASTSVVAPTFVRALWDAPIPRGQWRYFDGMLYMFGLLQASGQYRVWTPTKR
ncbi:hypothetical protein BH11ARM2_BH11ARM2_36820 [soil metagenome]